MNVSAGQVGQNTTTIMEEYSCLVLSDIPDDSCHTEMEDDLEESLDKVDNWEADQNECQREVENTTIDILDLLKTFEDMYQEKRGVEQLLKETLEVLRQRNIDLETRNEKIAVMTEDNIYLRTENIQLKNDIKQMKVNNDVCNNGDIIDESCKGEESKSYIKLSQELHNLHGEFSNFRKFMYKELTYIKSNINGNETSSTGESCSSASTTDDVSENLIKEDIVLNENEKIDQLPRSKSDSHIYIRKQYHQNTEEMSSVPLVPGPRLYSNAHISETVIITDSTVGRLISKHLKDYIDEKEENIIMKKYPGHTADEMNYYCDKPLKSIKPKQVIIIAGTNDISRGHWENNINEAKIVDDILSIARKAKFYGAERIFIASLLERRGFHYRNAIASINEKLYI